jgi:hypothetical protein
MYIIYIAVWSYLHSILIGYDFHPITERYIGIKHSGVTEVGKIDKYGDFHPLYRHSDSSISGIAYESLRYPATVYEYRSGALILMKIGDDGRFVPCVDTKILSFESYRRVFTDPIIWNLLGKYTTKVRSEEPNVLKAVPRAANRAAQFPHSHNDYANKETRQFPILTLRDTLPFIDHSQSKKRRRLFCLPGITY